MLWPSAQSPSSQRHSTDVSPPESRNPHSSAPPRVPAPTKSLAVFTQHNKKSHLPGTTRPSSLSHSDTPPLSPPLASPSIPARLQSSHYYAYLQAQQGTRHRASPISCAHCSHPSRPRTRTSSGRYIPASASAQTTRRAHQRRGRCYVFSRSGSDRADRGTLTGVARSR